MEINFSISVPLEAREPARYEEAVLAVAKWQESTWGLGQFAPSELTISRVVRSGRPRGHIPTQTLSEQWEVMVCQGREEIGPAELGILEESLKDLFSYLRGTFGLEEPAKISIGLHEYDYHPLQTDQD